MEHGEVLAELTGFIRDKVLDPSAGVEVEPDTPLLEWGILNSLTTTSLVVFIQERFGVDVPAERMVGRNFRDLDSITALVLDLDRAELGDTRDRR
ncbi:MAG: acyl carrier protein [Saccharothrix sp.]|nr:acyl carrier protein [Saccharothrix sp.]